MLSWDQQSTIAKLNSNWIWIEDWIDSSKQNTAGRVVKFSRQFDLASCPSSAILHISADTRYKLVINGERIAVGPSRGSPYVWYYDTIDIAPCLVDGSNVIEISVIRFFAANRSAMPFERTAFPGLTMCGTVRIEGSSDVSLDSDPRNWKAVVQDNILFPTGLIDDGFLHIYERATLPTGNQATPAVPFRYGFKTLNGDLLPWRLQPRLVPMPEKSTVAAKRIRSLKSTVGEADWTAYFSHSRAIELTANSQHELELQADVHSTAFIMFRFDALEDTTVDISITYSEGYELEPRSYPYFRSKADRLDQSTGHIVGPFDTAHISVVGGTTVDYEPFWFRTFRLIKLKVLVGARPVRMTDFSATQTNYPMDVKAKWHEPHDSHSSSIWDVSVRTLRNCMFDGYSDCPFYEQLQYSMDSRAVGLFHYLLSGDDRLIRQTLVNFAASTTAEGLTQSRFPSHVNQLIAGFPLYFILQVCDHHLYFGDTAFARAFVPRIDGILDFFDRHIDHRGLVSNLPADVWQFVDWVTTWHATDDHPDKGVPTSGRSTNLHTYFSMILAYVLQHAATLLRQVGRPGNAEEYISRASALNEAIRTHCFDGSFFTDSTAEIATDESAYSQHCQVFAVLCGAAKPEERTRLLTSAFASDSKLSKCSYMMQFYTMRAFALAGDQDYESFYSRVWEPWRRMLANNLTTWEEDDVRQRSDCHAWGSVPLYEYCTEVAGVQVLEPGASKILFKPRLSLSREIEAQIAVGRANIARVSWSEKGPDHVTCVKLDLTYPVWLLSQLPGQDVIEHGMAKQISLEYRA
ncbi:Six-hairpin glycosidase-like protein [Xylariaceae sp. FL0804]|nr:Six-hairpin glycosidase-like protein [Xylariaceae sp. FL0804]